ncbi:MAG: hypothetical protein DCC75_05825 [Proteobacteria bacterium]|nr:MAG: hypothetical protein DCC75_05825 [Pseudomonadota bacterium]
MPSITTQVISKAASQGVQTQPPPVREGSQALNPDQVAQAGRAAAEKTATTVQEKKTVQPKAKRVEGAEKNIPNKPKPGRSAAEADKEGESEAPSNKDHLDILA